jgi:NADH dehydrogenase (ubiquinone) 1 alpha subcomplex subunit 7
MAKAIAPRDVTPLIAWIRNTLSGRKLKSVHRFEDEIAPRTQPPPVLPEGPSHKVSNNWYCSRDGRRMAQPDQSVYHPRALPSGEKSTTSAPAQPMVPKPGFGYNWSTGNPEYKA